MARYQYAIAGGFDALTLTNIEDLIDVAPISQPLPEGSEILKTLDGQTHVDGAQIATWEFSGLTWDDFVILSLYFGQPVTITTRDGVRSFGTYNAYVSRPQAGADYRNGTGGVLDLRIQFHIVSGEDVDMMQYVSTASATVANTTDEATVIGSGSGSLTFAVNYFSAGKTIRLKAYGVVTNTGTPTLNIQFKLGAVVVATGAITTESGLSNTGWECEVYVTCRTTGASGTVFAQGALWIGDVRYPMVNTAADTVATNGTLTVDLTADWGAADAGNTITCTNLYVLREN